MDEARTAVPIPFDQYHPWQGAIDPERPLTPFQHRFVLSAFPRGARVVDAEPTRRYYGLGFPLRVRVVSPAGERLVLLRLDSFRGGIETEAALLPVIARLGLPVPELLGGPATDPERPGAGPMILISVVPGQDLLALGWNASSADLDRYIALVLEGIERLHGLTSAILADPVGSRLPCLSLAGELRAIAERGGPWMDEPVFRRAFERVWPLAEADPTAPAFSSGDYNPGNFLSDGHRLTGIVDFALSCFEDPHIGLAKYWTYDWYPYNKAGLVERYLAQRGVSPEQFALRLAVRCLWTLQRGLPVAGHDNTRGHVQTFGAERARLLELLGGALTRLA